MKDRNRKDKRSPENTLKPKNRGIEGADFCLQTDQDWESIFNSMTDMVTIHDKDFNIICANDAAKKVLGIHSQVIPEAKCYKYYHGTECPPEGCPSCRCLKTGEPAAFEIFEPHLNMYIEIRAIPRFDEEGGVNGLIHIVRDITERRKAEEEIERYRFRLEELVEERTRELTDANLKLRVALDNIKTLRGLIPICAWCKKVRDDKGYWKQVEVYVKEHSEADFTHGICQECLAKINKAEKKEPEKG
jgi:hypothetical protein